MYVGTQYFGTSKIEMEFLARHGVNHFDATVKVIDVETLSRNREAGERGAGRTGEQANRRGKGTVLCRYGDLG